MNVTAESIARQWCGVRERSGAAVNPGIAYMLELVGQKPDDAIPWCSAFVHFVCWQLGLPRRATAHARDWLLVGEPISLEEARAGWDVVIFNRGGKPAPVTTGPGHVAFFCAREGDLVRVVGGNQRDAVSVARFPARDVLGVRRLAV